MDKMIRKRGVIFEAGDYPDKNFKMTPEELEVTVQKFTSPVALDLQHKPSGLKRLDDKLGQLTEISAEGGKLFGTIEIPEWLDKVACYDDGKPIPLGVSCAFKEDKTIKKLALTDSPRVKTAAVFAAFSEAHPEVEFSEEEKELIQTGEVTTLEAGRVEGFVDRGISPEAVASIVAEFAKKVKTHEGQSVLQSVHDQLARAGAVCKPVTTFHSVAELSAIQQAHDQVVSAGATCRELKEGEKPCTWFANEVGNTDEKGDNMSDTKVETAGQEPVKDKKVEAPAKDFSTEFAAVSEENKQLREAVKRLEEENIKNQAKTLAAEIIDAKKANPDLRSTLEANFTQALRDDAANAVEITFSADAKGSRVDVIKAMFANAATVVLTEEALDEKSTEVLLSDDPKKGTDLVAKQEKVRQRAKELAVQLNKSKTASI
jgi:hypothetical protein